MDNKKIEGLKYASFISVVIYVVVYSYTLQYHPNPFPERTFPLYVPYSTNSTIDNSTISTNSS